MSAVGATLNPSAQRVLEILGRWAVRVLLSAELIVLTAAAGIGGVMYGAYRGVQTILPTEADVEAYRPPSASRLYSSDGELLAVVFDENIGYREVVPLEEIPEYVRQATIAIEDRRFRQHHGIDLIRIARAAQENLRSGGISQGASTLTQQLARNIFLEPKQTYGRKIQEACLAIQIERKFSKDEILEMYLNQVCFGHPAYGIQAAGRVFFGKDAEDLDLAEGALLAGLLRDQEYYDPRKFPDRAMDRRKLVLRAMVRDGYISQADADAAADEPIRLSQTGTVGLFSYKHPYFTTVAIEELVRRYGYDRVYMGGMRVYTTCNVKAQQYAEEAIRRGVERAKGYGCTQKATVVMDPFNGDVLSIVGGVGFSPQDQNNRATQAHRQPGSSFKPFIYTTAIEHGYTPYTQVSGATLSVPSEHWTVKGGGGVMSLASALAASVNPASVRVCNSVGPSAVVEMAHRMGIQSKLEPVLSIALGTEEVTVLEMTSAFCCFANGGNRVEPTTIDRVYDSDGVLIDEPSPVRERALSMHTAYVMNQMLQGVVSHGTGTAAGGLKVPTAGKTGTTDDHKDAWFVGMTPQVVCGVWAGNDVGHMHYGAYGGKVCAQTFRDIAEGVLGIIGKDEKLDFPGPGDERIRSRVKVDAALTAGGGKSEEDESKQEGGAGTDLPSLVPDMPTAPQGGSRGGNAPSYVIRPPRPVTPLGP